MDPDWFSIGWKEVIELREGLMSLFLTETLLCLFSAKAQYVHLFKKKKEKIVKEK